MKAFIDSIKAETGNSIVASLEDAKNMEIGKLYAIKVETGVSVLMVIPSPNMSIA